MSYWVHFKEVMATLRGYFPEIVFLVLMAVFALTIRRASKSAKFQLVDLFLTKDKLDPAKVMFIVGGGVLTWAMFALVYYNNLTEWFVGIYATTVVTSSLGHHYIRKKLNGDGEHKENS